MKGNKNFEDMGAEQQMRALLAAISKLPEHERETHLMKLYDAFNEDYKNNREEYHQVINEMAEDGCICDVSCCDTDENGMEIVPQHRHSGTQCCAA